VANDFEMSDEVRIRTLYAEIERLKGRLREYEEHAEPYWKAENERLKADNERLTDDLAMARADWNNTVDLKNKLRDGIERLTAEIEQLRRRVSDLEKYPKDLS